MEKRLKRIGRTQSYLSADVIRRFLNVSKIDESGIFFDGNYYIVCFRVEVDNTMAFERIYVNLRKKNMSYRVAYFSQGYYFVSLYLKSNEAETIETVENKFITVINECFESVATYRLNMNDLFVNMTDYFRMECTSSISWEKQNFTKLFQSQNIDFREKSYVKKENSYLRVYQIIDINRGVGNSENMYEEIMKLPGINSVVSDFDSVLDRYVVASMKKLYLDIDDVIAKIRLQNPDLYNAYISTNTQADDETYSFILAGLTLVIEANTLDKLDEYSKSLFECSERNSFEVLNLEDMQEEAYANLCLLSGYSKNMRMYVIDEGIDFLPYLYATK